ncbi:hypothetical protein [Rhizobium leguminosarum]|jgi:hypothetical protein|nr:hypothetical protein U8Q02_42320 [Rhizobium leguminosarum]
MTASRSTAHEYAFTGLRLLFVGFFVLLPLTALVCNGPERVRQFDMTTH